MCCWKGRLGGQVFGISHDIVIKRHQTRIPAFLPKNSRKCTFPYDSSLSLSDSLSFPKTNVRIPVTSRPKSSGQSPTWIPVDKRSTSCHRSPHLGARWTNPDASSSFQLLDPQVRPIRVTKRCKWPCSNEGQNPWTTGPKLKSNYRIYLTTTMMRKKLEEHFMLKQPPVSKTNLQPSPLRSFGFPI